MVGRTAAHRDTTSGPRCNTTAPLKAGAGADLAPSPGTTLKRLPLLTHQAIDPETQVSGRKPFQYTSISLSLSRKLEGRRSCTLARYDTRVTRRLVPLTRQEENPFNISLSLSRKLERRIRTHDAPVEAAVDLAPSPGVTLKRLPLTRQEDNPFDIPQSLSHARTGTRRPR